MGVDGSAVVRAGAAWVAACPVAGMIWQAVRVVTAVAVASSSVSLRMVMSLIPLVVDDDLRVYAGLHGQHLGAAAPIGRDGRIAAETQRPKLLGRLLIKMP